MRPEGRCHDAPLKPPSDRSAEVSRAASSPLVRNLLSSQLMMAVVP